MATLTPNIGLKKPAGSEYPKISDAVNDNADILDANIAKLQEGIAIIVDGDTASIAVPVGGYAYIKNNEHGLTNGLYKNTSSSDFPVSGGTADNTVFTAVPEGVLNALNSTIGNTALPTTAQTLTGAIAEHEQDVASLKDNIAKLQQGIAIIVDGDTASVAVSVSGYAYIRNNTHGLTDGLYKNISASAFPVSGGTADSTVFSNVPTGAVNDAVVTLGNRLVNAFLTYDSTNVCFPLGNFPAPRENSQVAFVVRNVNSGAIYAVWFSSSINAFVIGATLTGNAPGNGESIALQYFA